METTYQLEYSDNQENWFEIEISIQYETSYDGIGPYEFWGFKGFDKGELCIDIDSITYSKDNLPPEHIQFIELAIEKEINKIKECCLDDLKALQDSKDEHDYDLYKESNL